MKIQDARIGQHGKFKNGGTFCIISIHLANPEALKISNGNGVVICRPEEFETMDSIQGKRTQARLVKREQIAQAKLEQEGHRLEAAVQRCKPVTDSWHVSIVHQTPRYIAQQTGLHINTVHALIREAKRRGFITT